MQKAGFWIRFGSWLLDGLLYGLLLLVFVVPAIVLGVRAFDDCVSVEQGDGSTEIVCPPGSPEGGLLAAGIVLGVIGWLLVVYLYVRALGRGQTWGCRIVGIKVLREDNGEPLGFWRALGRQAFAQIISAYVFYLGYLWAAWDSKKQTWHDKVVGSTVVRT